MHVLTSSFSDERIQPVVHPLGRELRWLTYLLTDLGEQPLSPPVLYVDNKAMLALCQEHRLEHRTKHIALRYFLARELQQRGQLRLAYVASEANTADIFTKALAPGDHQRFCTLVGFPTCVFMGNGDLLVTSLSPCPSSPAAAADTAAGGSPGRFVWLSLELRSKNAPRPSSPGPPPHERRTTFDLRFFFFEANCAPQDSLSSGAMFRNSSRVGSQALGSGNWSLTGVLAGAAPIGSGAGTSLLLSLSPKQKRMSGMQPKQPPPDRALPPQLTASSEDGEALPCSWWRVSVARVACCAARAG
ncbi:unnamed protein product [Closterium sp. NIES-54]